jgi:hypothetical protein
MKFKRIKYLFDDIESIVHFDRDNSRGHDAAHVHGAELYAGFVPR